MQGRFVLYYSRDCTPAQDAEAVMPLRWDVDKPPQDVDEPREGETT